MALAWPQNSSGNFIRTNQNVHARVIFLLIWFVALGGGVKKSNNAFAQERRFVTGPRQSLGPESRLTASVRAGDVDGDGDLDQSTSYACELADLDVAVGNDNATR